ncbi:hypothetical protein ACHAXT_002185 [Thalassiosira profunda]
MAIGRPLPTAARRRQPVPETQPPELHEAYKRCKIKLEDQDVSVLPDGPIELYWYKERQWWDLDRKTVLHKIWRKSDGEGRCIASWGVRKRVKCKWRLFSEDNDYDEEESEASESEDEAEADAPRALTASDSEAAEVVSEPGIESGSKDSPIDLLDSDSECDGSLSSAPLVAAAKPESFVGKRVAKRFGFELHFGSVVHYCGDSEYWRIEYDDGDKEEFDEDELHKAFLLFGKERSNDHIKFQRQLAELAGGSWWESDDSGTEDDEDEDYQPTTSAKKKRRNTRPCDETEAVFGGKTIVKGRVYRRHVAEDSRWLVKVVEFTGKRLPVRQARCQVLFQLDAAVQDCFPQVDVDRIRKETGKEKDRRVVFCESIRGEDFLAELVETSCEDFDLVAKHVAFDLVNRRKKKRSHFIEFRRRHLQESSPSNSMHQERNAPKELVLFAGIGGCSIGDKEAGFDVSWLVENNPLAASSLRQSHPDAAIYHEDVGQFLDNCDNETAGYPRKGEVDHLQSSPTCKGFSRANTKGGAKDANNLLSYETVRATEIFEPRTGMLENVPGMLDERHHGGAIPNIRHAAGIVLGLLDLNYQLRVAVHNACDFGTPQSRQRLIFTFSRWDVRLPDMPVPTHGEGEGELPFATVGEALEGLNADCVVAGLGSVHSGIVQLPNNQLAFNHVASEPPAHAKPLCLDEPLRTVTTHTVFRYPHNKLDRTLSIRELARLFDMPDNKQFFGSLPQMRAQIGNAVPCKLAKAIACPILEVHQE